MPRFVLLDAGVIGLLASDPSLPSVAKGLAWFRSILRRADVTLPDVCVFEVRRELVRIEATAKLRRLADLCDTLSRAEVSFDAWTKAADFWAIVRRQGLPTAGPRSLDGDAILAGVAATLGMPGDEVVIATNNVGHLTRFPGVDAREWTEIR